MDRDSNPAAPQFLQWHKTRTNSKGEVYPCGEECYKCFDTRRRYFPDMSKDELKKARADARAVDDRFTELREDKVRGEGRFRKDEKVDVKALIRKTKAVYDDAYIEGTFYTLEAYAKKLGMAGVSEITLLDHLDKLGLEVVSDDAGVRGVEVPDCDEGQYRFKRGRRQEVASMKTEQYQDKRMQQERFEHLAEKKIGSIASGSADKGAEGRRFPTASGDEHSECSSLGIALMGRSCGSESTAMVSAMASPAKSASSLGTTLSWGGASCVSLAKRRQAATAQPEVANGIRNCKVEGKVQPEGKVEGKASEVEDEALATSKRRRRCSNDVAIESALRLIAKVEVDMSWGEHWNSKSRKRDFDALLARLSSVGRKCGSFLSDESAASTSDRCFQVVERLEARQALFEKLRQDFAAFVTEPAPASSLKMLLEAPRNLLGSILTMGAQQLVDKSVSQPASLEAACHYQTMCCSVGSSTLMVRVLCAARFPGRVSGEPT